MFSHIAHVLMREEANRSALGGCLSSSGIFMVIVIILIWEGGGEAEQQLLNREQYSQMFTPIERIRCNRFRLLSPLALRLNLSWAKCVGGEKKTHKPPKILLGKVHYVFFFICLGLYGVLSCICLDTCNI